MNEGSPYGWLFFAALGLGLTLSSLVRRGRSRVWLMAGLSLFLIALGGAFIYTDFIVPDFFRKRVLPFYLPLTLFFFVISLRLALLVPLTIFMASLIPIVWGSSGVFSLEEGIYPVSITCYPPTEEGRSYSLRYRDGRESTLTGCGDYLAVRRVDWDWRLFFLTPREYPIGFTGPEGESPLVELTLPRPDLRERPGMKQETLYYGPIENNLFYTYWLTRNGKGELILATLNPVVLP